MNPIVDLVVLMRQAEPLHPQVELGIRNQSDVQLLVHQVVGKPCPEDRCRWDAIARARNEGKTRGEAPWLMFLDDDVVLQPECVSSLLAGLEQSPVHGALAADYLGEFQTGQISAHVAMGATFFRREALEQIHFTWREGKCECQCCCDDLRRSHWAIDYCPAAKAVHLPHGEIRKHARKDLTEQIKSEKSDKQLGGAFGPPYVPSVCLVICYFGPFPGWIDYFLLSCAYNPTIDFLIFTDQETLPNSPPNVHFKRLDPSSFNKRATERIGIPIQLSHPRKICDFKPAYGHLFEEHIEGWNYWGYTDLDVIYGDLGKFLTAANLPDYDVFSARKEYLVGHFTLFRNVGSLRTLYQQSKDFPALLQSDQMLSFDECGKQWREPLQGDPYGHDAQCDSMTHVVRRLIAEHKLSVCFTPAALEWPDLHSTNWRLLWDKGKLWSSEQSREAMYFHFHAYKQNHGYLEPAPLDSNANPAFEMTPSEIQPRLIASESNRRESAHIGDEDSGRKLDSAFLSPSDYSLANLS